MVSLSGLSDTVDFNYWIICISNYVGWATKIRIVVFIDSHKYTEDVFGIIHSTCFCIVFQYGIEISYDRI